MKNNIFRPVEFWKASITVLPDNSFFELLRTVFGKIKTPFNKQILLGDLEKFLSRPDIQKNISGFIDGNDSRIIAAVAALNEPVPAELENFFAGEISCAELNDLVVNLEERFILYRFLDAEKSRSIRRSPETIRLVDAKRLALNPVLESILSPVAANGQLIFPSQGARAAKKDAPRAAVFDDRILAALLSFVSHNELFFKYGGGVRRKVMNAAKALFPALVEAGLETVVGSLQILGLFSVKDEHLSPDYRHFFDLGALTRRERMEYCAAALLCYGDTPERGPGGEPARLEEEASGDSSSWETRVKVRKYAAFIHCFCSALDPKRVYPLATLKKVMYMIGRSDDVNIAAQTLLDAAVQTGLLVQTAEECWQKAPIDENVTPSKGNAFIVMDSPFTFLVYPEIAYNDIIRLAAACCVIEAGSTVRFELTRDSVVLAFNCGFSANAVIELLQRLSHNRIDENLVFTLNDWEKRHSEVMLRSGLVLTLAPQQRYLAETRPLAKLIAETLAPGIYLLPQEAEEKAVEALRKAGVAIIAKANAKESAVAAYRESAGFSSLWQSPGNFYPPLYDAFQLPFGALPGGEKPAGRQTADLQSTIIEAFHSILKKMRLGKEEQDELAARINRRLVLCDSQLKGAAVRYEKLEARGLDYVGKAIIARQAMALQSPVEVVWPGRQKQERVFGIPKALEKAGSENILIVDPSNGGDAVRVSLGKISLLRRIKKSIFEGI